MNPSRIQAREVLAEALGLHPGAIASDAKPGSQQGWDSLAHMKLVLAIETARGHRLTSSEILALTSLDGIKQALQNSGTRPG